VYFPNMSKFTPIVFMILRFTTLLHPERSFFVKKTLVFLLVVALCPLFSQNSSDDTKKQADKLFKNEAFKEAYPYYSQLVANYPKDPEYNYRLGVCMIYSEPDKKKCIPFLKLASVSTKDSPKEVLFYLGKAYHINYRFDDAIKNYIEFKKTAPAALQKKLQVDREITACHNGKRLLSSLTDLEIISKKALPESDYFRSYDLQRMGKLLVKPDDFKSATDKKKKESSIVFLPSNSEVVYFSSYGDNTASGKDIYTAYRLPTGVYSKPEKAPGINTEYDEDYPFLHPDGKTLYFSSKGHNSMGGYDIFKSTYNDETQSWSTPINLEFPINSPDDDYLFVTDSIESVAYFSTGRQSIPGKIDVLKVKTKRRPMDIVGVKGNVIKGQVDHSLASSITVKDLFSEDEIGTFYADEDGNYNLELPNGAKLLFVVETPGMETQNSQVTLPTNAELKPYRQSISYVDGKLKILNYFDDAASDNSYLNYLNVIEKKAKLDVNTGDEKNTVGSEVANNNTKPNNTQQLSTAEQEIATNNKGAASAGLNNKELASIARKDAVESRREAAQLLKDSKDAIESGAKLKQSAQNRITESESSLTTAENIDDETERVAAVEEANNNKQSAESDLAMADRIIAFSESLAEDAKSKEKEAELNEQYANELEKAITTKDAASLEKLTKLQNEIQTLSTQKKESENLLAELKINVDEKEKQLSAAKQTNSDIEANLEEIKVAISEKEKELGETKKKKEKNRLTNELMELTSERTEKENQLAINSTALKLLNDELIASKNELSITSKIKIDDPIVNNGGDKPSLNRPENKNLTLKEIETIYKNKVVVSDTNSKASFQISINELNKYNADIENLLQKKQTDLTQTKNKTEKQQIETEIKTLEGIKNRNQIQISSNFNKITQLNQIANKDKIVVESNVTYRPIVADSKEDALTLLEELKSDFNEDETGFFESNNYVNIDARKTKQEAISKLNEALEKQKTIIADIDASVEQVKTISTETFAPILTSEMLYAESDKLSLEATQLRAKAKEAPEEDKPKIIENAKTLEEKALDKNLEASEVISRDNTIIIATNRENIQNLIQENKASTAEIETAKRLSDEAIVAFRKAVEIRTEAKSLTNKGSKLGSFSNAEDQEAEAIMKQDQAIEMLRRTSPNFDLKAIVTSTTLALERNVTPTLTLESALTKVNEGVAELAPIKIESYLKLYDANAAELAQLSSDATSKVKFISKSEKLQEDLGSANASMSKAVEFKAGADKENLPNEKLNYLISAVKQQNVAIDKLIDINITLVKMANAPAEPEVVANNPDPIEEIDLAAPNTATFAPATTNNEPVYEDPSDEKPIVVTQNIPNEEKPSVNTSSLKIVQVSDLVGKEESTEDIIYYFDTNEPNLSNESASAIAKTSLSNLKDLEAKGRAIDEVLTKNSITGVESSSNPAEMRKRSDALLVEAEDLLEEAEEAKDEAAEAKGSKKKALQAEADSLETIGRAKMFASADMIQKANETEYKTNSNSIDELIQMYKNDDPIKADELENKRNTLAPLKQQIANLRNDVNIQTNPSAKLGAIGNAEEKESELIKKQNEILTTLRKKYPDYIVKPFVAPVAPENEAAQADKKELRSNQFSELTNLINAFSLEYETLKNQLNQNLSPEQQQVKQNADDLNLESKRLLIASDSETDDEEKIKTLTSASRFGATAIDQIKQLLGTETIITASPQITTNNTTESDTQKLEQIGNDINANNSSKQTSSTTNLSSNTTKPNVKKTTAKELQIVSGNAYSEAKPIPVDAPIEEGLVFRVQIGAFRTRIPNNAFKGLSPLNGETTPSGYIRYTAGNFDKIENATAVKNDLKSLGYSDAFVVAYLNGKRISLGQALANLKEKGIEIDPNAPQTAGISSNVNVPRATVVAATQEAASVTKELEKINGLLFTVQIGVYNKQVTKTQLRGLRPIYSEQLSSGLYRYTAGIYNNVDKLMADKNKVVELGVKDAFASAYLNGKRISFAEAKNQQSSDATIRMETENPIVFPGNIPLSNSPQNLSPTSNSFPESPIVPFSNSVLSYPTATPENGVKTGEAGISYKVQIGAYTKQVPAEMAQKYSAIRNWPIENKQINGLFIYNVGNFSEVKFAKDLREELKNIGISDAFITVYQDGRKLYGPDAENYLR